MFPLINITKSGVDTSLSPDRTTVDERIASVNSEYSYAEVEATTT